MAFTIPLIVRLKMPNPEPKSGNCDVVRIWGGNNGRAQTTPPQISNQVSTNSVPTPQIPQEKVSLPTMNSSQQSVLVSEPVTVVDNSSSKQSLENLAVPNLMASNGNNSTNSTMPHSFFMQNIDDNVEPSNNSKVPEVTQQGSDAPAMMVTSESSAPNLLEGIVDTPSKDLMEPYNSVQNYNANVDDGAMNPNNLEIPVSADTNIPGSQSFINTSNSLTPNIAMKEKQPQIIIPGGQGISSNFMQSFGDVNVATEE